MNTQHGPAGDALKQPMSNGRTGPLLGSGLLLGTGLGGFLDGIVLHQILQWHNMLSSRVPPIDLVSMKVNMLWDGLFHIFTWIVTCAGVVALFAAGRQRDVRWEGRVLLGGAALGWGGFNVVEGLIDHQLLDLHHVHPGTNQLAWDMGFLLFGAALCVLGLLLVRRPNAAGTPHFHAHGARSA